MLASQLRHHPAWTAAGVAAELAAARDRLALMHAENLSVAAAFDLSYADLTPGQQRLFRRLGLVPGPSFDAYAAAALDGTILDAARRFLGDLYDQYLLAEPAPGRYQLHDLVRERARALAAADDPADTLNRLGELSSQISATDQAREQHTEELAIARDIEMPFEQARALEGLGRAYLHDGNADQAAAHLHQALSIYLRTGSPRAGHIQATLRDHGL